MAWGTNTLCPCITIGYTERSHSARAAGVAVVMLAVATALVPVESTVESPTSGGAWR